MKNSKGEDSNDNVPKISGTAPSPSIPYNNNRGSKMVNSTYNQNFINNNSSYNKQPSNLGASNYPFINKNYTSANNYVVNNVNQNYIPMNYNNVNMTPNIPYNNNNNYNYGAYPNVNNNMIHNNNINNMDVKNNYSYDNNLKNVNMNEYNSIMGMKNYPNVPPPNINNMMNVHQNNMLAYNNTNNNLNNNSNNNNNNFYMNNKFNVMKNVPPPPLPNIPSPPSVPNNSYHFNMNSQMNNFAPPFINYDKDMHIAKGEHEHTMNSNEDLKDGKKNEHDRKFQDNTNNMHNKGNYNNKSSTCNINVDGRERLQNDYNQNFINTGERPQNFIRDSDENKRFIKYPKLKQLLELKNDIIKKRSTPARYIRCDLRTFDLGSLDTKFDVILIDPPWKEYYDRKMHNLHVLNNINLDQDLNNDMYNEKDRFWTLEDLANIEIEKIAEVPSFLFIWCGVTHLEDARVLLNKWGYRRCEDICWLKTNINEKNKKNKYLNEINNENSYLQRTTEHCLVGIKGAVRRSYDIHLIHANLDTDVIIAEETEQNIYDNNKPEELYKIIEKFCLGRRKIELFGTNRNIRNGWLTLGKNIDTTLFNKEEYTSWFEGDIAWPEATSYVGGKYMGTTNEIENLRPKSPPRNNPNA
ncbi:mRNA methyltransferase, putative [Plasmodium sp. gorilla clade G2]|uniref:mRNA methyltransferase, putative n=1 Tax=Plasmodium sp. gorilla clade G2 TaxID=880535 RepID=UPI000D21C850|nr:mRNA methyltransferase, putative [Plasmodium sp. gorilla clade G2]SOV17001.1 mRNA methyltransferase, putative [Plasmodium sp. gorilla clade G2]